MLLRFVSFFFPLFLVMLCMQIIVQFESPFAFVNDKHEMREKEQHRRSNTGEQKEVDKDKWAHMMWN